MLDSSLAPLLAIIHNFLSIRLEAITFLQNMKRPFALRGE